MNAEKLYPAVITLSHPETVFSDEQLLRLVAETMGGEMSEFLRVRLGASDAGKKQVGRILAGLRDVMENLQDAEDELEDMLT